MSNANRDNLPVRPWFRERPPLKGGNMDIRGKLPRWFVLLLLVLFGGLFVWLPNYFYWAWDHGLVSGFGHALLIGAVLGFTIERWFREDFAKNVFYAALGELIRPEFRDEMRWLTSFKWLAVKSSCHVKLEDLGDGIVKITLTIDRELENISSGVEKIHGGLGVDEWGIPGRPSYVEVCRIQKVGGSVLESGDKIKVEPAHFDVVTADVAVDPGEKIKAYSRSVEFKHTNDVYVLALGNPTKDPEVELEISATLVAEAGFSHRGKMETEAVPHRKTLRGTYLPSQVMVVRWWPKPKREKP